LLVFRIVCLVFFGGDVEINQTIVKNVNIHQAKINVVKFDGTNKFQKGKENIGKSKTDNRQLRKNQYAFCKKKRTLKS